MKTTMLKNEDEPVVIADECGDTMWDEVLKQEVNACDVKTIPAIADMLPGSIDTEQAHDTTGA